MLARSAALAGTIPSVLPEWTAFWIVSGKVTVQSLYTKPADHGKQQDGTSGQQLNYHTNFPPENLFNIKKWSLKTISFFALAKTMLGAVRHLTRQSP